MKGFVDHKKLRCEICENIVRAGSFKSTTTQQTYFLKLENVKCFSGIVVYLLTCKNAQNNTEVVQKVFDEVLITIDMPFLVSLLFFICLLLLCVGALIRQEGNSFDGYILNLFQDVAS